MLPNEFKLRMKEYLKEDYDEFIHSYEKKPLKGIRVNPLKATKEQVKICFEEFIKTDFSPYSYVVNTEKVGNMPLHMAGAFYSQEPSAASAVTVLDPQKGDKVLDLCAAPGGKSTQIAGLLDGEGLLWSNEIVKNRANILLSNTERMGIKNAVVSSVYPDVLCEKLKGFFDKILVDAPCSGEGMFRKNPEAIDEWSLEHVKACALRQEQILNSAAKALKKDGILVYSTCTFSKEENEDVCFKFLENNKDFELCEIDVNFGRKSMGTLRVYPMDGGEGHFVAKFKRLSENQSTAKMFDYSKSVNKDASELYSKLFKDELQNKIHTVKDKLIILPNNLPDIKNLQVLRAGVELGEIKSKRIEPSHNLFTVQSPENCKNLIDFKLDDPLLNKYLHGEEIPCDTNFYTAVAVEGVVLGFGKASNSSLKNKYPKGLRLVR